VTGIRIATRGSELALWQAREVARVVRDTLGRSAEIVTVETTGDRLTGSLAKVGGKGLFVKEIEEALLAERADVAVHSAKDLPAASHPELVFAAFLARADVRDALVSEASAASLASLPAGARVGTGSVRRAAQLRRLRGDLDIVPLRGNVPTRLRKLAQDSLDAIVLACAGLDRLGLGDHIRERIAPETLLPAVAQGAIAVQVRADGPLAAEIARISHPATARSVAAERAFLAALGGDCNVPIAALAESDGGGKLRVRGLVISPDGSRSVAGETLVAEAEASAAGTALAESLLRDGAADILDDLRAEAQA
jgi:hydroxymethylbilane synthase